MLDVGLKTKRLSRWLIKFVNAILPPVARAVLTHLRHHGNLRFFGTFGEVARNFRGVVPYNSIESEREEVANALRSRAVIADARRGIAPKSADHYTLLCTMVVALPDLTPTILDIGGGTGDAFAHLVYSCPRQKPRLVVYELSPIVTIGRALFDSDSEVRFIDHIDDIDSSVDVVFLGSSLQYFEHYELLLNQVAVRRPRMIVVAYTPMTDAPTFVTAQVNMRRRVIPNKVINREELIERLDLLGFTLIYRSGSSSVAHFRNFPAPQRMSFIENMVFHVKDVKMRA
jgi:putative methyltransferase (TIGR04325 family)